MRRPTLAWTLGALATCACGEAPFPLLGEAAYSEPQKTGSTFTQDTPEVMAPTSSAYAHQDAGTSEACGLEFRSLWGAWLQELAPDSFVPKDGDAPCFTCVQNFSGECRRGGASCEPMRECAERHCLCIQSGLEHCQTEDLDADLCECAARCVDPRHADCDSAWKEHTECLVTHCGAACGL